MLLPKLGYIGRCAHFGRLPNPLTHLQRLRGHRDQISAIKFLDISANVPSASSASGSAFVITTSKDSFLKVWDLSTQHCVQTTIAHRSEVWSLDINPGKTLIFTGSSEGEMKVWRIDSEAFSEGLKENESGEAIILFFGCAHCII
jgi:U3 small nucleolar RNA-associated protein 12